MPFRRVKGDLSVESKKSEAKHGVKTPDRDEENGLQPALSLRPSMSSHSPVGLFEAQISQRKRNADRRVGKLHCDEVDVEDGVTSLEQTMQKTQEIANMAQRSRSIRRSRSALTRCGTLSRTSSTFSKFSNLSSQCHELSDVEVAELVQADRGRGFGRVTDNRGTAAKGGGLQEDTKDRAKRVGKSEEHRGLVRMMSRRLLSRRQSRKV